MSLDDSTPSLVIGLLFLGAFFGIWLCLITSAQRHNRVELARRDRAPEVEMAKHRNPYQPADLSLAGIMPPEGGAGGGIGGGGIEMQHLVDSGVNGNADVARAGGSQDDNGLAFPPPPGDDQQPPPQHDMIVLSPDVFLAPPAGEEKKPVKESQPFDATSFLPTFEGSPPPMQLHVHAQPLSGAVVGLFDEKTQEQLKHAAEQHGKNADTAVAIATNTAEQNDASAANATAQQQPAEAPTGAPAYARHTSNSSSTSVHGLLAAARAASPSSTNASGHARVGALLAASNATRKRVGSDGRGLETTFDDMVEETRQEREAMDKAGSGSGSPTTTTTENAAVGVMPRTVSLHALIPPAGGQSVTDAVDTVVDEKDERVRQAQIKMTRATSEPEAMPTSPNQDRAKATSSREDTIRQPAMRRGSTTSPMSTSTTPQQPLPRRWHQHRKAPSPVDAANEILGVWAPSSNSSHRTTGSLHVDHPQRTIHRLPTEHRRKSTATPSSKSSPRSSRSSDVVHEPMFHDHAEHVHADENDPLCELERHERV